MSGPRPNPRILGMKPYRVPRAAARLDLHLDGNEGMTPDPGLLARLADADPELLRRYPGAGDLEALLAARHGLAPEQVLVTGGADDALDRACRAALAPGRELVLPVPTFEMLGRYAAVVGADVVEVPWPDGPWPLDAVTAAVGPRTGVIALVSPNNPTGAIVEPEALRAISAAAPEALLLVDLAYGEFADVDLTPVALELPNALVFKTLSKAWGLAGLRVGYALGPAHLVDWLRITGNPYAVSSLSLQLATLALTEGDARMQAFVAAVQREREALREVLQRLGAPSLPSQANFVLVRVDDSLRLRDDLAALRIGVRAWPARPGIVRITCPGDDRHFTRLVAALEEVMGS